jgi:cytochrome c oxidase cbb3-type subunit 3
MKNIKKILLLLMLVISNIGFSQDATNAGNSWSDIDLLNIALTIIAFFLLIPIYFFSKIFKHVLINYLKKVTKVKNLKKETTVLFLIVTSSVFAQTTEAVSTFSKFNFTSWILILVIIIEILALVLLSYYTFKFSKGYRPSEEKEAIEVEETENALLRWWKKSNNFGAIEEEAKIDTGHSYDGIRELDNITPPWFQFSFYFTIVLAVIYLWYYHVLGTGNVMKEELQAEIEKADKAHLEFLKYQKGLDEETIAFSDIASEIEEGEKMYLANCASCHAADGGGGTGPNLTDAFWIHGGSPKDVYRSIKYGWKEKGMIPWKDVYNDQKILQLASFVNTLQGKTPVNPKIAEGEKYTPKVDSVSQALNTNTTDSLK